MKKNVLEELNRLATATSYLEPNTVYHPSPDDWAPFGDKFHLTRYLEERGFSVISMSGYLPQATDFATRAEIIKKTKLFIIDALVFASEGNPSIEALIADLNGATPVLFGEVPPDQLACQSYFCLIKPKSIRQLRKLRSKLETLQRERMPNLRRELLDPHNEFGLNIDHQDKFENFVNLLRKLLRTNGLIVIHENLNKIGLPSVPIYAPPGMGSTGDNDR